MPAGSQSNVTDLRFRRVESIVIDDLLLADYQARAVVRSQFENIHVSDENLQISFNDNPNLLALHQAANPDVRHAGYGDRTPCREVRQLLPITVVDRHR